MWVYWRFCLHNKCLLRYPKDIKPLTLQWFLYYFYMTRQLYVKNFMRDTFRHSIITSNISLSISLTWRLWNSVFLSISKFDILYCHSNYMRVEKCCGGVAICAARDSFQVSTNEFQTIFNHTTKECDKRQLFPMQITNKNIFKRELCWFKNR
jgi:lipopolysaccharide assembly outer membrane protein LptD (OstA)